MFVIVFSAEILKNSSIFSYTISFTGHIIKIVDVLQQKVVIPQIAGSICFRFQFIPLLQIFIGYFIIFIQFLNGGGDRVRMENGKIICIHLKAERK